MLDSLNSLIQNFGHWYAGLSDAQAIVFLFVSLAGCFVVLTKGADFLVDGAAGLAADLGVPKIIIGATVVSLGTTLPEAMKAQTPAADCARGDAGCQASSPF